MVKTRRKKVKKQSLEESASSVQKRISSIVDSCNSEMYKQLDRLQEVSDALIAKLNQEMQAVIAGLPNELAEMTVQEYIDRFLQQTTPVELESEMENVLSDATNKDALQTQSSSLGGTADDIVVDLMTKEKARKPKRKAPQTAKSSRSKKMNLQTPAQSHHSFKSIKGTPLFSKRDISHLNLSETPRTMKTNDDVSAFELKMYSDRGSPMVASEAMKEKIQSSLQVLMQQIQSSSDE